MTSPVNVKGFNLKSHQQLKKKIPSTKKWHQIYSRGGWKNTPPPVLIGLKLTFNKFSMTCYFSQYSKTPQMTASKVMNLAKWWLAFRVLIPCKWRKWPFKTSQMTVLIITWKWWFLQMTGPKISHFQGFTVAGITKHYKKSIILITDSSLQLQFLFITF